MDIAQKKQLARKDAFIRRQKAFETLKYDLTPAILHATKRHNIIASYMPMRSEISALPAMQALSEAGKQVVVPVIIGKNQALAFYQWTPDMPMIEGAFGALIPKEQNALSPDFVLAPMVAFDAQGTRLGYGGGFYDRSLQALRAKAEVPFIGLAFESQQTSEPLPKEDTDIPLDGIITENGYRAF